MATSFATSQRQRQRQRTQSRQRQRTATTAATATAILQNVLEIGLATVLERRGAFPPEFFVHQALGGGGGGGGGGCGGIEGDGNGGEGVMTAAKFDEAWLTNSGGGSRSPSRGRGRQAQSQTQSQTQQSQATGGSAITSSSSSGSSTSSGGSFSGSHGGSFESRTRSQPSKVGQDANLTDRTDHEDVDDDDDDDDDGSAGLSDDAPPLSTVGGWAAAGGADQQSMVSQLLPPSSYYNQSRRHESMTREGMTAGTGTSTGDTGSAGSMMDEKDETRTVGTAGSNASNPNDDDDCDDDDNGRRLDEMRSEALLLLEWIRRGVVEGCWERNLLSRVVVGVCVPPPATDNGGGGTATARLVESYAFDLSTAAEEAERLSLSQQQSGGMLGISGGRKKKQQQQQQQLNSEEDVQAAVGQMLRGIRGYIDANYTTCGNHDVNVATGCNNNVGLGTQSPTTQFTNFDELDEATKAPYYTAGSIGTSTGAGSAAAATKTMIRTLPKDRYFTFRVEFTKPISRGQLPPALNVTSEEFGTVPALGRVLVGKDALPNKSRSADANGNGNDNGDVGPAQLREPTADPRSLQRLSRWALGRVQPADGVNVGFNAYCEDPEDETSLIMGNDGNDGEGRDIFGKDDEVPTAELGLGENADPQKIFAPISNGGHGKSTEPSQESSTSATSIAIGQSVLAYPHQGKNDKTDAVEQALSCTVVDTRVHHVHGQQYKVEFDSSCGLEHLKQWMSSDRIVVVSSPMPTVSTIGIGGDVEERKRKGVDCSSKIGTTVSGSCRPKKRTRTVYRYITKPIRFKL